MEAPVYHQQVPGDGEPRGVIRAGRLASPRAVEGGGGCARSDEASDVGARDALLRGVGRGSADCGRRRVG
jgi:hypothetical protein